MNQLSKQAEQRSAQFQKEVNAICKAAGMKYKRYKQSAEETLEWTNPVDGRSVVVSGWHGTGDWGVGKLIVTVVIGEWKHENVDDYEMIDIIDSVPSGNIVSQEVYDAWEAKLVTKLGQIKRYVAGK